MCRISYKKSEVTKIVTYKMLYELKNHLFKRGIFGFDYLEVRLINIFLLILLESIREYIVMQGM